MLKKLTRLATASLGHRDGEGSRSGGGRVRVLGAIAPFASLCIHDAAPLFPTHLLWLARPFPMHRIEHGWVAALAAVWPTCRTRAVTYEIGKERAWGKSSPKLRQQEGTVTERISSALVRPEGAIVSTSRLACA